MSENIIIEALKEFDFNNLSFNNIVLFDLSKNIQAFKDIMKLDELETICNLYTCPGFTGTAYEKGRAVAHTIVKHITAIRDVLGLRSAAVKPTSFSECYQERRKELIENIVQISTDGKRSLYLNEIIRIQYEILQSAYSTLYDSQVYISVANAIASISWEIRTHWLDSPNGVFILNIDEI